MLKEAKTLKQGTGESTKLTSSSKMLVIINQVILPLI